MIEAHAEVLIARPTPEVYRFIALDFYRNYPRWSPEVVALTPLTPGPWREGALARQVRVDEGRRTDTTFRATRLEPDRRMLIDGVSAVYQADYTLTPTETGATLLGFRFRIERLEFYLLPFERLIRDALAAGVARTTRRLKALIETEAEATQPSLPPATRVTPRPHHHPGARL